MTSLSFSKDDLFILGNLSARAVVAGFGDEAQDLLTFIQTERPENAGGFLMQAVHMYSRGLVSEAIAFLDQANVFAAESNGDEAIAFYLVLLKADGQFQRALELGRSILEQDALVSESALHAVEKTVAEIEASGKTAPAVTLT